MPGRRDGGNRPEWRSRSGECHPLSAFGVSATIHNMELVAASCKARTRREVTSGEPWEVIVEPDSDGRLLVVVSAYPVWGIQ